MEDISKKLYEILKESCESCKSNSIAISGGLDSTIIAYFIKERKPKPIAIIAKDFVASDLTYSQRVSKEFNIPLTINQVSTTDILNAIEETIKILKNFNDIEIRNNVVMYLAIKWAKDQNSSGIITGDGADELFAGYNFLIKKSEEELEKEIQRVCSVMHFPTHEIGRALGITVESPFLNENVIEFAKTVPSNLKVREEKTKRYGKWILRKTFEKNIPMQIAWREKSPMQDGAGTAGLSNLFDSVINDQIFLEKKKKIQDADEVTIRTKESMYYYEIYRKLYQIPTKKQDSESCPYCNFNVEESKFCRMCGAFPI
ncbi:asparagine synthase C-terminal domain-containing protein [Nitrosarchaeum koreense]|uniref:Asparagine synthase n=1 Tax=Nitrosarchaeum koreense MY1 TaxID=1001994 RepID=F9CX31_9ARCH|nr:asparagine synthase C-terminal domain-containing protein [Nitrosarchaeum koreense]EGP93833.1 Asparagine synthase [Nitrosarchaeum koreense MY1]